MVSTIRNWGSKSKRNVEMGAKELLEIFSLINMNKDAFEANDYTRLKKINFLLKTGELNDKLFWKK